MKQNVAGSCLCGQVRFEIATGPDTWMEHCHCGMCRQAGGASVVTWIDVRVEDFRLQSGEVTHYPSSPDGTRALFPQCGSSLVGQREGSACISIAPRALD